MDIRKISEIRNLINSKKEGPYWDFKKQWYLPTQKNDLLIDIIAMSNNLSNHDGYIIIGVDEEYNYSLCDVSGDENRKNTDNLVDFLRDKAFAGGIRPSVVVESYKLDNALIDVIVVRNSINTPFYLTDSYQDIREGNIYSRIETSNTPKDKTADLGVVIELWRKRFQLGDEPLQIVKRYLDNPEDWNDSPIQGEMLQYYKYKPEYTLSLEKDDRDGFEIYMLGTYFGEIHPQWWMSTIYYHQTILDQILLLGLDDSRIIVAAPHREFVRYNYNKTVIIYCYVHDSLDYKIHLHYSGSDQCKEPYIYMQFMECIIEFKNEQEMKEYVKYLGTHEDLFDSFMSMDDYDIPTLHGLPKGYNLEAVKNQYKEALIVKRIFYEWLNQGEKD